MNELDTTALDNIRALQRPGTPDMLARIIDIFLQETPAGIEQIQQSVAEGDLETVRTTAHSIKSSAAYLGASSFSARMAELESAARETQLSHCQDLCLNLEQDCASVIDSLLELKDQAA